LEHLPALTHDLYVSDFSAADEDFFNGRVAASTYKRTTYWTHWQAYVQPLGLDSHLQNASYEHRVRAITGFAARIRAGYYGRGRQVTTATVTSAITAIGTTIALACGRNPTKIGDGSDRLLPRVSQMLDGMKKHDPLVMKKLPVEADIPDYIAQCSLRPTATQRELAVADLILIAFYYLLRVGEYTVKASRNMTKQTVQFRVKDVTFFRTDQTGTLRQLPRSAPDHDILRADSATLKLDNQKNGWKGVCVHHHTNGHWYHCPIRALGRRFIHIRGFATDSSTFLSTYMHETNVYDVTDKDVSIAVKLAGVALDYPAKKGIPIARIDTHSLRSGGANALSLTGYSDREIQKMGRWRSATFKEYIREELACFSEGMSTQMHRQFNFVNIAGGVCHDITDSITPAPDHD
jgi:hypothetical protein